MQIESSRFTLISALSVRWRLAFRRQSYNLLRKYRENKLGRRRCHDFRNRGLLSDGQVIEGEISCVGTPASLLGGFVETQAPLV